MIRKNLKTLIITSLLTLFPIVAGLLLWDQLPGQIATHWGVDGQADGWSSLPVAVFVLPLTMLAVQWLCVLVTAKDPGNQGRNQKLQALVLWIIPLLSNLCSGLMYALALGMRFSITNVMTAAIGILFMVIGNYMPKCKMNSTIGIKIHWTYTSEENWNATHRFAGKLWFLCGLILTVCGILLGDPGMLIMLGVMLVMVLAPIVYSWLYYRRQKQAGENMQSPPAMFKKAGKLSIVIVTLILIFVCWVMFTGDITMSYGATSFTIEASFHDDLTVEYSAIDSIEFREENVSGTRVWGFGSGRLLLGTFENEEFGTYTRYTYTNPEACIVMTAGEKTLVISSKTASQTKAIYLDLLDLTGLE